MLSEAAGSPVDVTGLSHLLAWQDVVGRYPNDTALISHHQHPDDFRWLAQREQKDHVEWSYAELDRAARRLATTLNRLTPIHRRPIAVLVNNQAEWVLFFWAAAYLHSPLAPINPKCASRAQEISHMLKTVRPAVVVTADATIAAQVEESIGGKAAEDIPVKVVLTQTVPSQQWHSLEDIMKADLTPPDTPTQADPLETAVILFTSGTTSLPKPCAISSAQTANAAFVYVEPRKLKSSHKYISHLPNFHSYGIGWMLAFFLIGGTVILPAEAFEAQASLACLEKFSATHMGLVPTTAQTIAAHPAFAKTNISSLVGIDISGAGIVPSVLESCEINFRVPAGTSYGMTESPTTLIWPIDEGRAMRDGQVFSGRPSRGARVKICAPGTRDVIERGLPGELHNGGAQVIASYMGTNVSTDSFYIDDNGSHWLISGDQAVMEEDGSVRISGRYKDIIIRGGENISPASIEACLQKTPGVYIAQVVGVPDETAGEVPIAVIQTLDNSSIAVDQLKTMTSSTLGPAFAPKLILNLQSDLGLEVFPTTANGKIRKVELAAIVRDYLARQVSSMDDATSTMDVLIRVWKDISGANSLQSSTIIQSFADSLMMMQLSSVIKRKLNKDITVEDFKECTTIQEQVDLIESRSETVKPEQQRKRHGPPTTADIPFLKNDRQAFSILKTEVTNILARHYLVWDDVEDIAPLPDWDAIFAQKARPQSWNLRWTYTVKADSVKLEAAMRGMLEHHASLRSIAIRTADETLLVSIRPTDQWFRTALTSGHELVNKEELNQLYLNDPLLDSAVEGGPMFKMHIASLREGGSGVVVVGSHAVCDMSMTKLWIDDVFAQMTSQDSLMPHVSFFDYANAYHRYRHSTEASQGVDYWTRKLRCLGSLPEKTFWPAQRAPEFFKGHDGGWRRLDGRAARPIERNTSPSAKLAAQKGVRKVVRVTDIAKLKAEHNVPVFMLVKAAIALTNVRRTGAKEAVFGTLNAARTWPFKGSYSTADRELYSGNPLDISGCTTEYVLDRVATNTTSSVVDFLQHVTQDEERNSAHVKAPVLRIIDTLRDPLFEDDQRTWLERDRDADAVLSSIRRQSFNWLPTPPSAHDSDGGLQMTQLLTRMDNGLTIGGFLADDKCSVVISLTWDAEHLTYEEAELALHDLTELIVAMGDSANWNKTVDEMMALI
ncbi:hypothetical protein AMS68_005173 [Peltaster fructicola]|uniref:Carrier domain-containing protein n=1 Tax=Peltaster fructicola TaxID=286661 RepID=A0A6H0XY97_9PEZI|nr:hypothetical protein AMS68_005173 [Peltaster fructicola]